MSLEPARNLSENREMNRQRGFTLIEVIIALGIMAVVGMGIADMMASQAKQAKAMSERLATQSAQNLLTGLMSNGAICSYQTNNPAVLTFNSSSPTAAAASIMNFNFILTSPAAGAPHAFDVGSALAFAPTVIPTSIQLKNFRGSGTSWTADWVLNWESNRLVMSLKPATTTVALQVDNSVPTATKITACNTTGTTPSTPTTITGSSWGDICKHCSDSHNLGCHNICVLAATHDCEDCGYSMNTAAASCPTGKTYFVTTRQHGGYGVQCFDF